VSCIKRKRREEGEGKEGGKKEDLWRLERI